MKNSRQFVDGILLLNKPYGLSSNAALQKVKRLFNAKKAGHTGSLDPLATGMLPICFGEATKVSQFLLDSDKHYVVRAVMGVRTNTGDAEGEVISNRAIPTDLTASFLEKIFKEFTGWIEQIPPMFSAVKYNGKPLYQLARKGISIERKPRRVCIHSIELKDLQKDFFEISIHCTKGTYVRTLIEDIGEKIGCGAHVGNLHRTAVLPYNDEKMYEVEELEALLQNTTNTQTLKDCLLPLDSSVKHLAPIYLSASAAFYIKTGQSVWVARAPLSGWVRLFDEKNAFIGIGEIGEDGKIFPKRLVAQ